MTGGFLRRTLAMLRKELLQLSRDRVTFATMIFIPLLQLMLFGYAINTNPRELPTAVLSWEESDVSRAIVTALKNSDYFAFTEQVRDEVEFDRLIANGTVLFGIEIPANFERDLRRGDRPTILVAADATDPVATGSAIGALTGIVSSALSHQRGLPDPGDGPAFGFTTHARYNPAAKTQLNVVPGLLGVILTMTMLVFTALSVTRERERGTMEALLSMPIRPVEIMFGKILPYVGIGFVQATIIIGAGALIFGVPVVGSLALLAAFSTLFITTNLSIGYTFSTIAQNQLQAVQMSFMFFLPNMLLSGFMFPFAGMPTWARWIGEALPLTHYIRMTRGIMLKGNGLEMLQVDLLALVAAMVVAMAIAVARFRQTLD